MADLIEAARRDLAIALGRNGRAAVGFSGGKESVVLAHLLEPYRDRVTLVWVNTGAMLPHMADFVRSYGDRFDLAEIRSDQGARWASVGVPSRIVPIFNTQLGHMAEVGTPRILLTDWITCCAALRSAPLLEYMAAHGMVLFIHGQKQADNVRPFLNWPPSLGRLDLLWDWSDDDVWRYIEANRLALPMQYQEGYPDSFECWNCPAEVKEGRVEFLARLYPDKAEQLGQIIAEVYGTVTAEMAKLDPIFRAACSKLPAAG